MRYIVVLSVLSFVASACEQPAAKTRPAAQAGIVVDSIFPIEEDIRRFERTHDTRETMSLRNAVGSRAGLVRAFARALERSDTNALARLALDASEFIELYYPVSSYARPPYRQSPALVWFQFQQHSSKGIGRALARYGGQPAGLSKYVCDEKPTSLGTARLWPNCVIEWSHHPTRVRVFGTILELDGRFKFVSYANDL